MYIRKHYRRVDGERKAYWSVVETYRSERGPRQRVVAYLGECQESERQGVRDAAVGTSATRQGRLFDEVKSEWVEVDASRVRVERCRDFGGSWLALQLMRELELDSFLRSVLRNGCEEIPWWAMAQVLIVARLCEPSSELYIAEHLYERTALEDLLGVPAEKVNDDRLYRSLDRLESHKEALERHLKERLGTLFDLEYDLLLYDVTSTYFEGEMAGNADARRGYSRDHRPDCKQVCIGLVVTRGGFPLGYELFAGNRSDVTTVEEIVSKMESRYGRAKRIWVMDRGMVSEDNIRFLKEGGRKYIVGTPKGMLKRFEQDLLGADWNEIREGLQVKKCASPVCDETFILCRSLDRLEKEKAIHERFEKRIEEGLRAIAEACAKRKQRPIVIAKRVGGLLGRNSRSSGLFNVQVGEGEGGRATIKWIKHETWRSWSRLSEGCYLLRTNVADWSADELWRAYIQLTDAEAAFRVHKSDLGIRPIWHQKPGRVRAHILVCFLAYVLWRTLSLLCARGGLGDEPRKVFDELQGIKMMDVVMPTRKGVQLRKRCVSRPTPHQAILLDRLGLRLPSHIEMRKM